ncbi:MAG: hypothetical protein QXZ44_05695 [Ferroplasma sp.]
MDDRIKNFDNEAAKYYKGIEEDFPRGSIRILSPDIIHIIIENARKHRTVSYSSGNISYNATFSSYTKLQPDGMVGRYTDVPEDDSVREIVFTVTGFHREWDTEVTFSKDYMSILPDREIKHLINFQRAILTTGIIN